MAASVDYLFATPLVRLDVENAATLNAALRIKIIARMKDDPKGIARSNTGGWHSETDMMGWATREAQTLFTAAMRAVGPVTADTYEPKRDFRFDGDMWANVSGSGHSNAAHCHTGALWSGVYYVEAGTPGGEGELVLEDPRFPMNQMYMPGLVVRDAGGAPMRSQHGIRPRAGMMVLFPSWLKHSVRAYRGEGQRISVAFNLRVVAD